MICPEIYFGNYVDEYYRSEVDVSHFRCKQCFALRFRVKPLSLVILAFLRAIDFARITNLTLYWQAPNSQRSTLFDVKEINILSHFGVVVKVRKHSRYFEYIISIIFCTSMFTIACRLDHTQTEA